MMWVRAGLGCLVAGLLFYSPVLGLPGPPQNDAGSGGDAPNSYDSAMEVPLGVEHHGQLDSLVGDVYDFYRFAVHAGQAYHGWIEGRLVCGDLYNESGRFTDDCQPTMHAEFDGVATRSGWWTLQVWFPAALAAPASITSYAFVFAENGVPAGYVGSGFPHDDFGLGFDAVDSPESWLALPQDAWCCGLLPPLDVDVFSFQMDASGEASVRFGPQPYGCLTFISPSGVETPASCFAGGPTGGGLNANLAFAEQGTWFAKVDHNNEITGFAVLSYTLSIQSPGP